MDWWHSCRLKYGEPKRVVSGVQTVTVRCRVLFAPFGGEATIAELRALLLAADVRTVALLPPSDGAAFDAARALAEGFQAAGSSRCVVKLCAAETPHGPVPSPVELDFPAASWLLPAPRLPRISLKPVPGGKRPLMIGHLRAQVVDGALVADTDDAPAEEGARLKRARLVR